MIFPRKEITVLEDATPWTHFWWWQKTRPGMQGQAHGAKQQIGVLCQSLGGGHRVVSENRGRSSYGWFLNYYNWLINSMTWGLPYVLRNHHIDVSSTWTTWMCSRGAQFDRTIELEWPAIRW